RFPFSAVLPQCDVITELKTQRVYLGFGEPCRAPRRQPMDAAASLSLKKAVDTVHKFPMISDRLPPPAAELRMLLKRVFSGSLSTSTPCSSMLSLKLSARSGRTFRSMYSRTLLPSSIHIAVISLLWISE